MLHDCSQCPSIKLHIVKAQPIANSRDTLHTLSLRREDIDCNPAMENSHFLSMKEP